MRSVGDQEQGTQRSQTQECCDAKALEEGCTHATQVARARLCHVRQRCLELSSRICRSNAAEAQLLRRLYRRSWHGDVPAAVAVLEVQRTETKNAAKLDELIGCLWAWAPWILNYRQRRIEQ